MTIKLENQNSSRKGYVLIKNSIVLFLGKFSTQFLTFLLLPIYTSRFDTAEYGIVDLITTYIILLVPVITIQTEMYVFRFLIDCRDDDAKKTSTISNSLCVVTILSMCAALAFLTTSVFIEIQFVPYILFLFISTILANILLQTVRGLGKSTDYSMACFIIGIINAGLNVFFIYSLNMGIESIFLASIIANAAGSLFLFFKNKIYKYISVSTIQKSKIAEIIKYSLPLVPNGVVWWVIDTSDRVIISFILGLTANGVYSISNKFSHIVNSVYSIFNMSWTETVSMHLHDKDKFIEKAFNSILKFLCSFCLILTNAMFVLFKIFVRGDFNEAYNYSYILIIASIFSMVAANLSAIYIAAKKTRRIATTTIFAAACNLGLHLALVNAIGLNAAAISTLVSFFILAVIRFIDVQKIIKIKIDSRTVLLFMLLFAISAIQYYSNNLVLQIIGLCCSLMIVCGINRHAIKRICTKIIERIKR